MLCSNKFCSKPVHTITDSLGRLVALPCEPCSRYARGLCYSCPARIPERDSRGFKSRFCNKCKCRRNNGARLESNKKRYKKNIMSERKRAANKYLEKRDKLLAKRAQKRRLRGLTRNYVEAKERKCSCGGLIIYYTRPPKMCDDCYERLAIHAQRGLPRDKVCA